MSNHFLGIALLVISCYVQNHPTTADDSVDSGDLQNDTDVGTDADVDDEENEEGSTIATDSNTQKEEEEETDENDMTNYLSSFKSYHHQEQPEYHHQSPQYHQPQNQHDHQLHHGTHDHYNHESGGYYEPTTYTGYPYHHSYPYYQQHHENQHTSYSKPKVKTKVKKIYVPVYVPDKDKKKMKIISVNKGFAIAGGNQLPGKFKSLKHCMKACAVSPTCFAGDYNPWLHKCYIHTNFTACNAQFSHPQFVHFSKVPCCYLELDVLVVAVVDAPSGNVALGVSVQNGIEQKGIDSLSQCIKKCASAGGGIQATVAGATINGVFDPAQFARNLIAAFGNQACFAIDYDFTTHKCFFFGNNVITTVTDGALNNGVFSIASINYFFLNCLASTYPLLNTKTPTSLNAIANPTTVHITFCPTPSGNIG